ncbi:MAG TPA: thioesterase family protein [Burkholderiales bacterium]|nr:thioesterase family protein [Burkholderiales bacterium]
MNKVFVHDQLIRFSHCDPAAIVYFPRFFDLAHATMEDWFANAVGFPLPDLIVKRRVGTPTVSIHCDFSKPLRMGDTLRFELRVTKLGNASANFEYRGMKDGSEHLRITQTVVFMNLDAARAVPIPEDVRSAIEPFLATAANTPL